MAAMILFHIRRQLWRERMFRDRNNPIETYTDEEMLTHFKFHRHHIYKLCVSPFLKLKWTVHTEEEEKPLSNDTRDSITRGLVDLLKPAVDEIDDRVKTVRESQVELRQQIDSLCEDLKKIAESDPVPMELEPYVKKLNNSRRRIMLVSSILQNVQDRLNKLHTNISKETARRKTMLDPGSHK